MEETDDLGKYRCGVINSFSTGVEENKRKKVRQVSYENEPSNTEGKQGWKSCSIAHISVFALFHQDINKLQV